MVPVVLIGVEWGAKATGFLGLKESLASSAPDSQHSYPCVVARSVYSMVKRVFPMPSSQNDR